MIIGLIGLGEMGSEIGRFFVKMALMLFRFSMADLKLVLIGQLSMESKTLCLLKIFPKSLIL